MIRAHEVLSVAMGAVLLASCGTAENKRDSSVVAARAQAGMGGDTTAMKEMKEKSGADLPASISFSASQIQHGGIRWGPVAMGAASGMGIVPGEVTPNEDRTMRLGAPVRGRVVSVAVRPGDRVGAGQTLVTLQSPEAGMAQSDVSKAAAEVTSRQAEVQYAMSARARAERLLALKAIPRQDFERAVTDDQHARAALTQAQAELRRARGTAQQLGAAGASGTIEIRAPAAGVVLSRSALPGAVVEAGTLLVIVTDPASLWLTINAPEQMAGLFQRNGRLRFTVPAFPADTFSARIEAVGAGLEADTRTLSVRAIVATSGRLKPQMLANVVVEGVSTTSAAFVPEDAVQVMQGKAYVFLVRPDGKGGARFEPREVVVGSRAGGRVAVLRGLAPGDVVVTMGAFAVKAELQKGSMPKMEM